MTDDDIIDEILANEGSEYTDDPGDRGGPTKFGITLATLSEVRGQSQSQSCTADDVKALTESEARAIYRARYIEQPGFGKITDDHLRAFLADWGVNSGPATAIKALQRCIGAEADGILGPLTIFRANNYSPSTVLAHLIDARADFYRAVVAHHPEDARFLAGWLNRNDRFRVTAST